MHLNNPTTNFSLQQANNYTCWYVGSQGFSFRTLGKRRQDMKVMCKSMNRRTGWLKGHMSQESSHWSFQIRFVFIGIEIQLGEQNIYQASQNGADLGGERKSKSSESKQGLAGVDVFFAKQLLSRRGPPSPQTDKVSLRNFFLVFCELANCGRLCFVFFSWSLYLRKYLF